MAHNSASWPGQVKMRGRVAGVFLVLSGYMLLTHMIGLTVASTPAATTPRNLFAADIYQVIANEHIRENMVISPASIHTSMALAFYGAKEKTAQEMQTTLRFATPDVEQVARQYSDFQHDFTRDNYIRLFNSIYINENLEFRAKFKELAQRSFDSQIEKADFHPPYNKRTAERINKAVEQKTNAQITSTVDPNMLNDLVEGIIVNAISFNGPWQKAFKNEKTTRRSFREASGRSATLDTMWTLNNFNYGELSNLNAKVIELPYQNSKYSMLIFLPNNDNGLQSLVQGLAGKDLNALVSNVLSSQKVEVYLPKFTITFGTRLEEPLKKLGMTKMFTREGNFGNMYRMFVNHYINSAIHKARVEVTEAGAEPALEEGELFGIFSRTKKFDIDHPFVFAIKHEDSIIFMGHVSSSMFT